MITFQSTKFLCHFHPKHKAWDITIQNKQKKKINIAVDMVIAYAGERRHFKLAETSIIDIQVTKNPVVINLTDGDHIKSIHACKLAIPWPPEQTKVVYIIPGLANSSSLRIKVLCDVSSSVIYSHDNYNVCLNEKIVWSQVTLTPLNRPTYIQTIVHCNRAANR